ncbi:MAG: LysM peptidoglycan-binding domain-containing protein [Dethiobacteria bacterium]|jgi:N-acetylmuramoyl-L-alanine amidase
MSKTWKRFGIVFSLVIISFCFLVFSPAVEAAVSHYVVPGDTLWLLAQRYNTTTAAIMSDNNLSSSIIYPGQVLSIASRVHTVRSGETMWIIANNYGVALQQLLAANPQVPANYIYPGQKINIPAGNSSSLPSRSGSTFSQQDIDLLARLVHAEAAGEPYIGQVAAAASVLNRIKSPLYPNTVSGVVYQVVAGCYQYSPVLDGRINLPANRSAYQAVYDALAGWDPSNGALGFYNPAKTSNQWVRQQMVTTVIGNHVFFR